jgi:hypothetical protein
MKHFLFIISFSILTNSFGQELNCNVIIDAERAQTQERQIFKQMQEDMTLFMNQEHWTEDDFEDHEKINCTILIQITTMNSNTSFSATAQIQVTRPIFGTDYNSILMNFPDKNFDYQYYQGVPLQFNENSFSTNLTSLLAFYAYVILGTDYDTFSELGGTQWFEKARDIANIAATSTGSKGWRAQDGINSRYFYMDNLINSRFIPFRKGTYTYHRKGLDILATNPTEAKKNILSSIEEIEKVRLLEPSSVLIKTYFNAKMNELVNIYSTGDDASKKEAAKILKKVDPTNLPKWEEIEK